LGVADGELEPELRSVLASGDDYATAAKPQIDWDDADARSELIDSRARDAFACLGVLHGRDLDPEVAEAGELLATVVGQDLEETDTGTFRIARRVAKDRVISTVDPEARHGHKTAARGFDGYKGHVAMDPDSEIITDTVVSAGNAGDASVADQLIGDIIDEPVDETDVDETDAGEPVAGDTVAEDPKAGAGRKTGGGGGAGRRTNGNKKRTAQAARTRRAQARRAARRAKFERRQANQPGTDRRSDQPTVYGDAAYGTGGFLDHLAEHDIESRCKTQPPTAPGGLFAKDRFTVDLDDDTVTCPAGVTVTIRRNADGDGIAYFAAACADCPLRAQCTNAKGGRTIRVGRYEHRLAHARRQQQDPDWANDYRATRPKVERKLGHMMRRKHGGRRARVRGTPKVDADFNLLAAAQNLARLAVLGLRSTTTGWAVATP
ncbi:MAG: transposase, partial [Acidimicrobiales bacterium]